MKEFLNLILAGATPIEMGTYFLFAYIGLVVNLGADILKRKPKSPNSPYHFSWAYWWADNRKRIPVSIALIPLFVILCNAGGFILTFIGLPDVMNIAVAFGIGMAGDGLAIILKIKGKIKGCKV
jgi:hypothetical protein